MRVFLGKGGELPHCQLLVAPERGSVWGAGLASHRLSFSTMGEASYRNLTLPPQGGRSRLGRALHFGGEDWKTQ